jgi:hypothetical protein
VRRAYTFTEEQIERIEFLVSEGVTTSFIADDLGAPRGRVSDYLRNRPDAQANARAFSEVWPSIRPNDELRKWHNMFAPKEMARS